VTNQIEAIMALADEYANAEIDDIRTGEGKSQAKYEALKQALEAALKPGYKADVWHEGSQSFYRAKLLCKLTPEEVDAAPPAQTPPKQEPRTGVWGYIDAQVARDMQGFYEAFGTATPPTQTPNGLFVDLIAQHPGLAEELKAIDDMPMPTLTPPPRLKDTAVEACIKAVEDAFAWTGGHGEPSKPGADAIANIIRSHFHVMQTPPPRLTEQEIEEMNYVTLHQADWDEFMVYQPSVIQLARAIETAVRTQFGVTNE
jgi:hypothetical protein